MNQGFGFHMNFGFRMHLLWVRKVFMTIHRKQIVQNRLQYGAKTIGNKFAELMIADSLLSMITKPTRVTPLSVTFNRPNLISILDRRQNDNVLVF